MGVQPNLYQGTIFLLALHAKGQTTCLKIVDIRGSLKFNVTIARTADIKRGTTDLRKINLTHYKLPMYTTNTHNFIYESIWTLLDKPYNQSFFHLEEFDVML